MARITTENLISIVSESPHVFILGAGASRAAFLEGDRNGKLLPLMNDLVEIVGLSSIFESAGIEYIGKNFEGIYDQLYSENPEASIIQECENKIAEYFSELKLPARPTLYDYLLLSLRPKDVIATFNWDPLLVQAYLRNSHIGELPHLLFLHGNVAIGSCNKCLVKGNSGASCKLCGRPYAPTRLLYPVSDKSYDEDVFISTEWEALRLFVQNAYFLTIFGYSAPKTDILARELMLSVWESNEFKEFAQIEIIDIRPKNEIYDEWSDFIIREHFMVAEHLFDTYLFRYPRRSCDAFASASLMLEPWPINRIPEIENLVELQEWISPLIDEEKIKRRKGI